MEEGTEILVEKVDHGDESVRRRLVEWLTPHEVKALFLVGNLQAGYPGSHLYVARRGEGWVGVGGYYERPTSASAYALDGEAVRALVRHMGERHPEVTFVNVVGELGRFAIEAMVGLGYEQANDPWQVFMGMEIPAGGMGRVEHEEKARPIEARDGVGAARLMRYLQRPGDASEISGEEIERVMMNPWRMVLEVDGNVVATATTNGVGVEAFQILGVATHERHRRKGYARAVCAALVRRMQREGAKRVVLFTGRENKAAKRCYAGLGFEVIGEYCMAKFRGGGEGGG